MSGTSGVVESGGAIDVNGELGENLTVASVEAVQTSGTHVGTPSAPFTFVFNGQTLTFLINTPFIANSALYTAINASSTAAGLVTWSN